MRKDFKSFYNRIARDILSKDLQKQQRGIENIRALGDFDLLLTFLQHPNSKVRCEAIIALGYLKDKCVVDVMVAALKEKDKDVRFNAAWALGWYAALGLGWVESDEAVPALIEALKDDSWSVCAETAKALGEIGDKRAVEPLIQLLESKYRKEHWTEVEANYVRFSAALALGDFGDKRALPVLYEIEKNDKGFCSRGTPVAYAATMSIQNLGNENFREEFAVLRRKVDSNMYFRE